MQLALGVEALAPQLTGIGRYTWELASRLQCDEQVDSIRFFRASTWHKEIAHFVDNTPAPRNRSRVPLKLRSWLERREFSRRLYHGPNFFYPPQAENAVVTVHDLSVFRFPETHPVERIRQFEREFRRSIEGARHIITDTVYIKNELSDMFAVDPARITAVPLGVSESFFEIGNKQDDAAILRAQGLADSPYCLCVATIEPRKGLDHAVKAFLQYRERTGSKTVLAIVGAAGWNNSELHRIFEEAAATGAVRFVGFVSDTELRAIYRNSSLFLYPSLYEGFGLPVLEAMACRVPVIISDKSCLPEVSQGVSVGVNVEDHDEFSRLIEYGLDNTEWRASSVEKGIVLSRKLNWENCVKKTIEVYQKISI